METPLFVLHCEVEMHVPFAPVLETVQALALGGFGCVVVVVVVQHFGIYISCDVMGVGQS